MAFDIDSFLSEPVGKKNKFKNKNVEKEFEALDPNLKRVAETMPTPATVTSGRRDIIQNAMVGGVPNSYHTKGQALDFRQGELTPEDKKHYQDAGYEIIPEGDHDHVEPSKNFKPAPKSNFDIDSFLNEADPNQSLLANPESSQREDFSKIKERAANFVMGGPPSTLKDINKEVGGKLNSFGVAAARSFPGSDLASAGLNKGFDELVHLFGGKEVPASFSDYYKFAKQYGQGIEDQNPDASLMGRTAATIPLFMAGMGAQGAGAAAGESATANLLANMAKSGATSVAVGQGGRGLEIDPKATAIDAALGVGGEAAPVLISKASQKIGQGIKRAGDYVKENVPVLSNKMQAMYESGWNPFGGINKLGRETQQKALKQAFEDSVASKKAAYESGLADLEHQFATQEAGRELAHTRGVNDLGEQFASQEQKRIADYLLQKKAAKETVKSLQSKQASNLYREVVNPIEDAAEGVSVSAKPIRDKINTFLTKGGLMDKKGNINQAKIDLLVPEVREFNNNLASISNRLKQNPTLEDLLTMKKEIGALRDRTRYSSDDVRMLDDVKRAITETYDNLIEGLAGKDISNGKNLRSTVQQSRAAYRAEKTLNEIVDEGTSARKLTNAIEERGRDKLKEILTPAQYQKLMDSEAKMIASEAKFERAKAPQPIPFQKATPPQPIPFQKGKAPEWMPPKTSRLFSRVGGGLQGAGQKIGEVGTGRGSKMFFSYPAMVALLNSLHSQGQ